MTAYRSLLLFASSTLVLAGCATGAAPTGPDGGNGGGDGAIAKGVPCEDNTSGVELFSDASISESPEYGQLWGEGSALTITYDGYTEGTLSYDLSYVQDDGGVIPITGGFFADPEGKTFTSTDPLFNTASDGYYGIVTISITTTSTGTTPLGEYCIVLGVTE